MNYKNQLFLKNNLELLKELPSNSIDLIFCDILYNTGKTFDDYEDKLGNAIEAMQWYEPRLKEMWRVIKDTGAVYLHCNYRLVHYLRVELDKVFGVDSFRNEIIWNQGSWHNLSDKKLQSAHESMLFYAKPNHRINESIADQYTDVWTLEALNQNDRFNEKVGYEGQKPIEYVERVISISSKENYLVADFFLGSGTTCVAAKKLNRNYLGCDINPRSIELTEKRLLKINPDKEKLVEKLNKFQKEKEDDTGLFCNYDSSCRELINAAQKFFKKENPFPKYFFHDMCSKLNTLNHHLKMADYDGKYRRYHQNKYFETMDSLEADVDLIKKELEKI